MFNSFRRLLASTVLVACGATFGAVSPLVISTSAQAQQAPGNASDLIIPSKKLSQTPTETPSQTPTQTPTQTPSQTPSQTQTPTQGTVSFPDVSQDYWARPFIQALAERNIIAGFPDGTYKPEQPVTRAEFAAIIQKAFNQNRVRQLPTGGFRDIRSNFWAAQAITTAFETGFLSGYPDNTFRPNQQITKVQAVVSLASGLGLTGGDTATLANFYSDATAIPTYAVSQVAGATQASVVVNYPDIRVFNPEIPLTRAAAAAHVYQALVRQGRLQPIASNLPAASYIVGSTQTGTTPPGGTQTGSDIVSTASASSSFTVLASLLRTAGLADSLQQGGPFTVFAPTDEAFARLPKETLDRLQQPENRETLIRILTYHVVPGQLTASQLKTGEINTAEGKPVNVKVNTSENRVTVNNAQVTQADISASNGVIHAINRVLVPSDVSLNLGSQNQAGVEPGRATRGGRSYIGAAGNIGLTGGGVLGIGNFAVISKIGLTDNFSVRPGAVFGDTTVVLVPITFDLAPRTANPTGNQVFGISPYIGAGVAIETNNNTDIGLLLTGGLDIPLASRFTLNGAVNAAFLNSTDVGIQVGVGFNF